MPTDGQGGLEAGQLEAGAVLLPGESAVYVATSPRPHGIVGRYFETCQEADSDDPTAAGLDAVGVARYALDPDAAEVCGRSPRP